MSKDKHKSDKDKPDKDKNEVQEIHDQLKKTEEKCQEYLAGWQRCQADYQNLQKEHAAKVADLKEYAKIDFLKEFLPVIDNYNLALNYIPPEQKNESWVIGIMNIQSLFNKIIEETGMQLIPTVGEDFNPALHQAIAAEKSDEIEAGKIIKEVSKGYKFKDQVVIQAKVIVSQ